MTTYSQKIDAFAALGEGDKAAGLFSLLNPINHARMRADVHRYKVEPYVVAADVYARPPHVGRGGWTWYTGSAGWMQRAGIESILGLRMRGAFLQEAGLVTERREGTKRLYRARPETIAQLWASLEVFWSESLRTLKVAAEREEQQRRSRRHGPRHESH